jgi:hypothetical protein
VEPLGEFRIAHHLRPRPQQALAQVCLELARRHAAEREVAEVTREERVERRTSATLLDELQEQAAFLVRDVP